MHKKLLGTLLTIFLVGGLLVAGASPAWAVDPPASFLPDEDGAAGNVGNVLSDRFDGHDALAHLTVVATTDTTRVTWYACPVVVTDPVDDAELATCNVTIGTDTEGRTPTTGILLTPADEAFDVFWDIPNPLDQQFRDVLALACVGDATVITGPNANCRQTLEEDIQLDDAQGGAGTQTTSGEMFQICTSDIGGPSGAVGPLLGTTDPCQVGGDLDPTAGVNAQTFGGATGFFKPFNHGDAVPNDGFVLRARTSFDVPTLDAALDTADANDDPDAFLPGFPNCVIIDTKATYTEWECAFEAGDVPDNTELAVWITDFVGVGEGLCVAPACILDSHYIASTARAAVTPTAYFEFTEANDDVDPGSSCATPDTEDTNPLGPDNDSRVFGCLQDQFGDPFVPAGGQGVPTFEQSADSVGALQCDPDADDVPPGPIVGGTPEEVFNNDFDTDRCSNVPPSNGPPFGAATRFAQYPVDLVNEDEPGTQTVTFCLDQEPAVANPEHGCADEPDTAKVTVTKIWIALPDQVFLAFTEPAPTDPADPCRTGTTFRKNKVGDRDTVIVCTFDSNGNPATTDQPGGGRLRWTIETTVGGEKTAVKFVGPQPPSETDATGQATVDIRAIRNGSNFIIVELLDANGTPIDDFRIEKRVRGGAAGGGRVQSQVTIRGSFKGQVVSEAARCEKNRRVILKKKRPGKDRTVGSDITNRFGNWKIRKRNPNGRFYAQIKRTRRCTGDKSPTVRK